MRLRRIVSKGVLILALAVPVLFSSAQPTMHEMAGVQASPAVAAARYHLDFDSVRARGPHLNAKAVLLVNYDNGEVVYGKHADEVRPIASISKLMTAMTVLDLGIDLDSTVVITAEDAYRSSTSRLPRGTEWTVGDLLHAMLMNSDNRAARALARAAAGSIEQFAEIMNAKAAELGLEHTSFVEPSGLDSRNVSTAAEVALMLHYAYDYRLISQIMHKKSYTASAKNSRRGQRLFVNTNRLLWSSYDVFAGKTGYIRDSDYCLASLIGNKAGERLTLVVLGVPGDRLRFREAQRLLRWGFDAI